MSEWLDLQQNKHDSPKLHEDTILDEQIAAALDRDDRKRLVKLGRICTELRRGKNVQNRQLQTWLSEDNFPSIDAEWQEQLALCEELKDSPGELKR